MAKFHGKIGFTEGTVESPPGSGRWEDSIVEYTYFGDVVRTTRQLREGEKVLDDLSTNNSISIVADAYANEHYFAMLYIWWEGVRWKVDSVTVERPRLILGLGGVYNGPKAPAPEPPEEP